MILSDRDIRTELEAGRIIIDPYDERCLQPSSVDTGAPAVEPPPMLNPILTAQSLA